MIFKTTGQVGPDLFMLGHPTNPVYLLQGETPVVVDAGLSVLGRHYIAAIRQRLHGAAPAFLLLTHAHFDHCGAAAALKQAFPDMQIVASPKSRDILDRPNALQLIGKLNAAATPPAQAVGDLDRTRDAFRPFAIDRVVCEGDVLPLANGRTVQVLETPGHTRDSLSYFLPRENILFPGEAVGVPDDAGYIVSDCLQDYKQYAASLERLATLDAETLCIAHYVTYTGRDAAAYFKDTRAQCDAFRRLVETAMHEEEGDLERVMARIRPLEYDGKREDAQPESAYIINLAARIKAVMNRDGKQVGR